MKKYDIVALGELLVDFMPLSRSEKGNARFEAAPGGAPCNMLAMAAKAGRSTAFIGKVGDDFFGHDLARVIGDVGIDNRGVVFDADTPTTLAFVQIANNGEREFSFYRNPGADLMLRIDEIDKSLLENTKIFHFGSLSLTDDPARSTTFQAIETAKNAGSLISFDPNLRPPLWDDLKDAADQIKAGLSLCDILKIADNELLFITGEEDMERALMMLSKQYGIPLIFVTLGKEGSLCRYQNKMISCPAAAGIRPINTTGAGDTFFGAALSYISQIGIQELSDDKLTEIMKFANTAAGMITMRQGSLAVMPTPAEIYEYYAR